MGARGLINGVARNDDKSTIQQKCMEKYIPLTLAAAVSPLMSSLKKKSDTNFNAKYTFPWIFAE